MKLEYAVWGNMFVCYNENKEVLSYLHEIPLEILSVRAKNNNLVIKAHYQWQSFPEGMCLYLLAPWKKVLPQTIKSSSSGSIMTYVCPITEQRLVIRAVLEYKYIKTDIQIQASNRIKTGRHALASCEGKNLVVSKKQL